MADQIADAHLSTVRGVYRSEAIEIHFVSGQQYEALKAFKTECRKRGLIEEYDDVTGFAAKFARQLAQKIISDFPKPEPTATLEPPVAKELADRKLTLARSLSDDARDLLIAAANSDGKIFQLKHLAGTELQVGERNFIETQAPREVARWKHALNELIESDIISDAGYKQEVFYVTDLGYRAVDLLLTLPQSMHHCE